MEFANHLMASLFDESHWCSFCEEEMMEEQG